MSPTWRERCVAAQQPVWWKLGRPRGFGRLERWLASNWATCAVGEQHLLHPQVVVMLPTYNAYQPYEPQDEKLGRLGGGFVGFYAAVVRNDPRRAERLLDKIEDRVLQLKRSKYSHDREGNFVGV